MSNEAADIVTEYAHIVRTPGILGGEPRLRGHRIRVRDVAAARDLGGHAAEEIAGSVFPSLTLAEVYAALAYFEDHKAELNALAAHEADRVAQFELRQAALSQDRRPRAPIDAGE